jgi:hypothetical protein
MACLRQLRIPKQPPAILSREGNLTVTSVHLLWHVHNDDEKLIGVYATNADAVAAEERLRQKPGFVDTPEGFEIHEYQLNQDHWTEGYVCV